MTFGDRVKQLWDNAWNTIQSAPRQIPASIRIRNEQVDIGGSLAQPFTSNDHYFQVIVNEMYLSNSREWFSKIDPTVLVVSEFIYDKKQTSVPFVVGPGLVEKSLQQIPDGMLFQDTLVAGAHPYRGGRLILSVVLCQVERADYIRSMLKLIETAAGALNFATQLNSYLQVADVVLTGVETLFGRKEMQPLIGQRIEFNPDIGRAMTPGYFALIDAPESQVDQSKLWVRENRLVYGDSPATAKPYRVNDYVLYSIARGNARSDTDTLPFYTLFEQVKKEAARGDEDGKKSAKANMLTLWQQMTLSPDLTTPHRDTLQKAYVSEMLNIYQSANQISVLGGDDGEDGTPPEIKDNLRDSLKILDL